MTLIHREEQESNTCARLDSHSLCVAWCFNKCVWRKIYFSFVIELYWNDLCSKFLARFPKLPIAKFWGINRIIFFRGEHTIRALRLLPNISSLSEIRNYLLIRCHGILYIGVKKINYGWTWLMIYYLTKYLGVLTGDFWGFGCPNDPLQA